MLLSPIVIGALKYGINMSGSILSGKKFHGFYSTPAIAHIRIRPFPSRLNRKK